MFEVTGYEHPYILVTCRRTGETYRFLVGDDGALVHDDVGVDRLAEMVVGRDDRAVRQFQGAGTEPVEFAIDVEIAKLPLQLDGKPVRQRALAEIVREQERLAGVELLQRGDDLVQLGVHVD